MSEWVSFISITITLPNRHEVFNLFEKWKYYIIVKNLNTSVFLRIAHYINVNMSKQYSKSQILRNPPTVSKNGYNHMQTPIIFNVSLPQYCKTRAINNKLAVFIRNIAYSADRDNFVLPETCWNNVVLVYYYIIIQVLSISYRYECSRSTSKSLY